MLKSLVDSHKTCHGKPRKLATAIARAKLATADPEFVAYLRTQNFTAEQAVDVAEKLSLSGLHSASDFLGFYSTKGPDMYRWWNDQAGLQSQGNIY